MSWGEAPGERDPLDPDDARALLRVLRSSSRNRHWEDFTADEHESIMRLIAQGALTDTGATVQPNIETQEALTQGYRTTEGDFPPASRFRTKTNTPTAELQRARQLRDRYEEHEI